MKTDTHLQSFLAQLFLEREVFHTNVAEAIKAHISCSITFFSKIVPYMNQCGKIF